LPTAWHIKIPAHLFSIECGALNPQSWMGTSFPYWEGPIGFTGTHAGAGYLEMTGY
jgi:predicted secreted hydrolase